jgi:hypothetical protein
MATMYLGFKASPLCPMSDQGSPEALLKLQMAPRLIFLMSLGSKKKGALICMSEWGQSFMFAKNMGLVVRDASSGCYGQWVGQLLPRIEFCYFGLGTQTSYRN